MEQKRRGGRALWPVDAQIPSQRGFEAVRGEQPAHRVGVGVLGRLPVAPRVAALVLVHLVRELHVTRVRLSQQAAGEARVTEGATAANKPAPPRARDTPTPVPS